MAADSGAASGSGTGAGGTGEERGLPAYGGTAHLPSGADGDLVEPEGVDAGSAEAVEEPGGEEVRDPARSTQPAAAPASSADVPPAGTDQDPGRHRDR